MKNSISFCIATAKNEKEYIKLLLHSLKNNTNINDHEILVFIDSDNQNTYEELVNIKKDISNLRIYRNANNYPVGGQRNISIMFNAASNDIVCYLQSDMVVGKNFDQHILKNMSDKNTVLTCSRIEPPLHPPSPEKIHQNFGVTPEEFKYDDYNKFVEKLQGEHRPNMEGHFAPFAIYKSAWFDKLGGFDTQFRCSREDSDMIIRMRLAGLNMVQTWDACVYHFTCVSSRGKDWYKQDKAVQQKNILQQLADNEELKRFIRKWGLFGHHAKPIYDIGIYLNIDQFVDFNILQWIEMYCKVLYINNENVANELNRRILFNSEYYSNLRWEYSTEHWDSVKKLFNHDGLEKHIVYTSEFIDKHEVNIKINYSELIDNFDNKRQQFIENINGFVHASTIGQKNVNPFHINILAKNDLSQNHTRVKNMELLLDNNKFVFV